MKTKENLILKNFPFSLVILLLSLVLIGNQSEAQTNNYNLHPSGLSKNKTKIPTEIVLSNMPVEKNYWLPVAEVVGLNVGVWAYSRYLTHEHFAYIGWESMKNNLKNGFKWDYDNFPMNQFWHPYHGANYFNAARSNGLDFWESAPYVFLGSLSWEYFMENEPPSYNDLVNTTVTGIILGEISFRVSNLIIDESTQGFERVLREVSSTIINPMQGFNRMIRGDMWKSGKNRKMADFNAAFSSGIHNVFFDNKTDRSKSYLMIRFNMNYGNQYDVVTNKKPFDYFSLHTEFDLSKDDNITAIFASGVMWDNKLALFKNSKNIFGIYKEIDILINAVYRLSASSVTGQIINIVPISSGVSMENFFGISAILLGATDSQYASEYGKDYNLGPGASAKAGFKFSLKDFGNIFVNYKRYWIHTLYGADGEQFVGLLKAGLSYNLSANMALGFDFLFYERFGDYKFFPNTQNSNSAVRFFFKQNI